MSRETFTLRLDHEVLEGARRAAAMRGCSVNAFIAQAVERAVTSADPGAAAERRRELRGRIAAAAGGSLPPAADLIREMREGAGRRAGEPARLFRQ